MSNHNCDDVSSRQSTKPRKKNALAHGIYAKDILLPRESRKEFEKLLADLQDDFRPVGRTQNDIVFDLAHLRWQKYRVHKMRIAAAHGDPFVSDLVKAGQKSWPGMRSHLRTNSINERAMSKLMDKMFLADAEKSAETLVQALHGGKLVDSQIRHAKGYHDVMKNFTIPLIEAYEANQRSSAEDSLRRTYSPEYLERIIRLEATIDARIDKALARLVNLQEYERMRASCSAPLIPVEASTSSGSQRDAKNGKTTIEGVFFERNINLRGTSHG
jgi:hypothetical protein